MTPKARMKPHYLILLAALMGSSSACLAHEDRIIPVSPHGMMVDIPAEFGPAQLAVTFAAPESGPRTRIEILFNLRTAKIIKIDGVVASDDSEHHAGLNLSQRCSAQELEAVLDPAAALKVR